MKTNMGSIDRYLRLLVVALAYILVYTGFITGVLKIVVGLVGLVLVLTSLFGICPLYSLIGVNTCRNNNVEPE